jgi:beta-lactamase class D
MKSWIATLLLAGASNLCIAAAPASAPVPLAQQAATLFNGYQGCFLLYDLQQQKIVSEYNPQQRCSEPLAANSTFKVALSLMAFDQGIINQQTVFKWDGIKRELDNWNQDQTPKSWLQNSALWVSQDKITPQLGVKRIQHYLAAFHYGNQDFSGDPGKHNGLTHAWLSSSLRITAFEQLAFIKALQTGKLPVSHAAMQNTKQNLYLGKLSNGADYYGKTGAGRHKVRASDPVPGPLRDGWFVGMVEHGAQQYVFVSNLTDTQPPPPGFSTAGSTLLKPLTLQLLNAYFGQ